MQFLLSFFRDISTFVGEGVSTRIRVFLFVKFA